MAILGYFFDAIKTGDTYDRVYNSEDMTSYLDKIVGSGVFPNPSTQLQVRAASDMNIVVGAGQGWINGHKMISTTDLPLTVPQSDVVLNRIDIVIFYVDFNTREMGIELKKGTLATTPTAPALVRNTTRYEMCLAQIKVDKQVTAITNAMITDTRGNSNLCGYVQGLIQQVDTTTLFQQWQDGFDEWFSEVKETLSTSTLIRRFEGTYTTQSASESSFDVLNYVPQYNYLLDVLEVRINGLSLRTTEYTMNGSTVILNVPITHIGTPITFVVYKSVDGSEAETVIDQVADMQRVVNMLETGVYIASGVDDNIKLSDAVKAFLQQTSKNMLDVTLTSRTNNGVTFDVSNDGVITCNGTATGDSFLLVGTVELKRGVSYMLTGCPVGGGTGKYRLYFQNSGASYDEGNGSIYTPTEDVVARVVIAMYEGQECNDLTFYPMVRLASISDGTFEPYGTQAIDDYRQIEIDVYGDLACTEPATVVDGSCYWFDFYVQNTTRRVKLNFEHCPRIVVDASQSGVSVDSFMYVGKTIEISNMQAVMNNVNGGFMVSNGDGDAFFEKCAFWLNGATTATGYLQGASCGTFNNCRMSVTAHADNRAFGFSGDGNLLRLNDCEILVYNPTSSSKESNAVYVASNEGESVVIMNGCSCPIRERSSYKQDNTVRIAAGMYSLVSNVLGKASSVVTGTGRSEVGTIIASK